MREIFEKALGLDRSERAEFVEAACGADADLKDEVLSLIAAHDESDTFLETSALAAAAEPLTRGQTIGPYEVIRELGRGGMGVVYLAEDARLRRQVALKALNVALAVDPKKKERFRREARLAASLSHPSIATVYALEEVAGQLYIASEHIDGQNLREELTQGPLPTRDLIPGAIQIAEGLVAAHVGGVVHRDLKPENIVRDRKGRLKILDFGLALLSEPDSSSGDLLTQVGSLLGTPAYMSPEQLEGEPVDFRSDLFSFGVLIYELATTFHPLAGKTPISTAGRILEAQPKPLTEFDIDLPELQRILDKCLQKSPVNRYSSTQELLHELRILAKSEVADPTEDTTTSGGNEEEELRSYWWVVHQIGVLVFYATMTVVLWDVAENRSGTLPLAVRFAALICAMINGTFRTHLLFTARFNRRRIRSGLRQVHPWKRIVDGLFCLLLMAGAVLNLSDPPLLSGVLAAVAVGYAVVFLVVEPATVRSIFHQDQA